MRLPLLSFFLVCTTATNAQLINGSFENGAAGWNVPCECAPAYLTAGGALGGGTQCMGLENIQLDCVCMFSNTVGQSVQWITPGPWRLSGSIKSGVPFDEPGSRIALNSGGPFSAPSTDLWSFAGYWEYKETIVNISGTDDLANMTISLVPDDGSGQGPAMSYFDDIQLTSMLSTGVSGRAAQAPAFRPNPAADKLWIDMAEAPTSLTCVDASGRIIPLPTFRHAGSTVEVDVGSVPQGLNVMLVKTMSGIRTLRFIKA